MPIASTTGASFTGFTVNVKLLEPESSPSSAVTVTVKEPLKSESGLTVKVEPSTEAEALSAEAENVTASPSTSLADRDSVSEPSSSIV